MRVLLELEVVLNKESSVCVFISGEANKTFLHLIYLE